MSVTNTLSTFEYYVAEHTDNGLSRIPEQVATDAVRRLAALEAESAKMHQIMHRLSDMSVDVAVHLSGDERRAFGRIVNEADAIIGRTWLPPMNDKASTRRLELWQVPARELDNTELEQQYKFAADKFDSRGEHGGSPGEFWAERMDEIDQERKRRSLSA